MTHYLKSVIKARAIAKGLHNQGLESAGASMKELAIELQTALEKNIALTKQLSDLLEVAEGFQGWVKAVPDDVAAALPTMPGIDGDWADEVMGAAKATLK
ncbi:hypothetical protein JE959_001642 [Aeromonas veronii]|nr:hypothetical protein [Aeromonas veronii]